MKAGAWLGLSLWAISLFPGRAAVDPLEQGFKQPPPSARPWVYWFWLNGNITSNGITADLEAMKRVNIGGVLIMEVDQGAPVGPVDFMSTRWRDLFKHVVGEARRLGLEVNMNNDAGWNGSGGPWIKPEQAMQKVVFAETNFTGPSHFEGIMPRPDWVAGFYRDICLLAFPKVGDYRISNIKIKGAYEAGYSGPSTETNLPAEMVIDRKRLVDISGKMDENGRVTWDIPEGEWTLLRVGHTCTGVENAPSPKSGRGLECDKLSTEGIEANFAGMMALLAADNGIKPEGKHPGLVATHIDSWENGSQNWTAKMRQEFWERRGYDLAPYLPALSGRVVGSLELSERFLWDLRRTVSELVITNYAGRMRELAHEHGMRFTVEAYGGPCDVIPYGGEGDEPMGEFWTPGASAIETCKGMASAAHVYGKKIVGAEAFTSADQERWREHPGSIKALGDRAFCEGINRFVFHRYALQPWPGNPRPGMMMGPWGQHYERTETWWEQSTAWHEYLARCQFLLRQGMFVADICYLQAEAPPHGVGEHPRAGYNWDECGAEAVLGRMSVTNGRLVLPDDMNYRVLVLPDSREMTPELLQKITELVREGATVLGAPPQKSPSLNHYPQCDEQLQRTAAALWGNCDGQKVKEYQFGKGRVLRGVTPEEALRAAGVPPDFTSDMPLRHIHRAAEKADIYFVANPSAAAVTTVATFRISGGLPELWWPESGRLERAGMFECTNGTTTVVLNLAPSGSVFVLFRKGLSGNDQITAVLHDGKEIYSTRQRRPPVKVQNASYGVPGDPQHSRDVREQVQRRVDGGETSFPVRALAEDDDPAPNVLKSLTVDYAIGERTFRVKGQDPTTIHLTADAVKATVQKATYGILDDPKRTRDVRDKLQRLLDSGETSFAVARMAEGDDPAFNIVKTLIAQCEIDGKDVTLRGTDPEVISLKAPTPQSEAPAEVHSFADGKPFLQVWQAGQYAAQTAAGYPLRFFVPTSPPTREIAGPWQVRFPPNWGAPPEITLDRLISWPEHNEPGVRFFSGTATYLKAVEIPREMLGKNRRLFLDLGRVEVMAQVKLNGKDLGTLWKEPFMVDITDAAKSGVNHLEIKVVNLWPNRLIGDEQLPEDSERNPNATLKSWPAWLLAGKPSPTGRFTFSMWRLWKKDDPLLPSGLLGPVRLRAAEIVRATAM